MIFLFFRNLLFLLSSLLFDITARFKWNKDIGFLRSRNCSRRESYCVLLNNVSKLKCVRLTVGCLAKNIQQDFDILCWRTDGRCGVWGAGGTFNSIFYIYTYIVGNWSWLLEEGSFLVVGCQLTYWLTALSTYRYPGEGPSLIVLSLFSHCFVTNSENICTKTQNLKTCFKHRWLYHDKYL